MGRATHHIIRMSYYCSLLLGTLRFDYNFRTGHVRTTRLLTLYSVFINVLLLAAIPPQFSLNVVEYMKHAKARYLYHFLYLLMSWLRAVSCVITLAMNWWQRHEIIDIIVQFQRLQSKYFTRVKIPETSLHHFRSAIIRKFLLVAFCDLTRWTIAFTVNTLSDYLSVITVGISMTALSQVMNHIFFAASVWNLHLDALNEELARLVGAINLTGEMRRGRERDYQQRCAQLAQQLRELSLARKTMQRLAEQLNKVYGVQAVGVLLNMYLLSICTIYLIYSLCKQEMQLIMGMGVWSVVVMTSSNLAYYYNLRDQVVASLRLSDKFKRADVLLQQLTLDEPVNAQMERTFEFVHLRNACEPYDAMLLGFFKMDTAMMFAAFASIMSHSIILLQYDYKYF